MRKQYAENPEKFRARSRSFYTKNQDSLRDANREKVCQWKAENWDRFLEGERRRRHENPELARARTSRHRAAKRTALDNLRSFLACEHCGSTSNLRFHHRDPATKSFNVSDTRMPWSAMLAEMRKCDVLCQKCHKAEHKRMKALEEVEASLTSCHEKTPARRHNEF
jgi:5-methylcytosine-specific restriction endonuclease McrA